MIINGAAEGNLKPVMTWEQAVEWLRREVGQEALVKACYFDDPLLLAAERFHASAEWTATRALMEGAEGRALDIGAGRGIASYALARDGWKVTALEPDPSKLVGAGAVCEIVRQTGLPIAVEKEYSEQLPFPDSSFDLVYGRQVLHHARDLRQTCREIARVLKPGGLMIATREHVISHLEDLPAFLESHPLHRHYGGEHAYLRDEYCSAIRSAGLNVVRTLGPYESPINYFPMTEKQHVAMCVRYLHQRMGFRTRVGRFLAKRLADPGHHLGQLVSAALSRKFDRADQTPGRLYSFVGKKPVVITSMNQPVSSTPV